MIEPHERINKTPRVKQRRNIVIGVLLTIIIVLLALWKYDVMGIFSEKTLSANFLKSQLALVSTVKVHKEFPLVSFGNSVNAKELNTMRLAGVKHENGALLEVCALAASEAEAFFSADFKATANMASGAIADAVSKLIQSKNTQEKATGLLLATMQANIVATEAERLNTPGCKADEPCFFKQFEAQLRASEANAEPLVKLALNNQDASLYAVALYACGAAKTGSCASISYRHLAEMEPDNAAAWLMAASEAAAKKDSVTLVAALKRAASARSYNRHVPSLSSIFLSESVQTQPLLVQSTVATELNNFDINIGGAQLTQGVFSYCYQSEPMNAATRSTCEALAIKLEKEEKTLIGVQIPLMIGNKIGWNAERLQPLSDEMEAATGRILQEMNEANKYTCEKLALSTQAIQRSLTLGQRSAGREIVEKSGKSFAEVAAEYRGPVKH